MMQVYTYVCIFGCITLGSPFRGRTTRYHGGLSKEETVGRSALYPLVLPWSMPLAARPSSLRLERFSSKENLVHVSVLTIYIYIHAYCRPSQKHTYNIRVSQGRHQIGYRGGCCGQQHRHFQAQGMERGKASSSAINSKNGDQQLRPWSCSLGMGARASEEI